MPRSRKIHISIYEYSLLAVILQFTDYRFLSRDFAGDLYAFKEEPSLSIDKRFVNSDAWYLGPFNDLFAMIKVHQTCGIIGLVNDYIRSVKQKIEDAARENEKGKTSVEYYDD